MSVTNLEVVDAETGNGVKVAFDFAFKIFSENDLLVYKETATDVFTAQTIIAEPDPGDLVVANTCWVSFDSAAETGTVTYSEAPASGKRAVILRSTALTQGSVLPRETAMPEETLERMVDRLTLIVQELSERLDRAVVSAQLPPNPDPVTLGSPTDGYVLQWQDNGNGTWTIVGGAASAADSAAAALAAEASAAAAEASATAAAATAATLASSGLLAARPAAPATLLWYYSTDAQRLDLYIPAPVSKWFLVG